MVANDTSAQNLYAIGNQNERSEAEAILNAINLVQAVISFQPNGIIQDANPNFLSAMGYSLEEIKGQHHRMFCDPIYAQSEEYRRFWERLSKGEAFSGEYRRLKKGGSEIWISASYNPIIDASGRVIKVLKFAMDISSQKLKDCHIEALSKSQAFIEFDLDGNIQTANENFLNALGYQLSEIKSRHHAIFCDPSYVSSEDYKNFWADLKRGEFKSGQFKRFRKDGKEIYIQATYNPIYDLNNKPFKVVKYATDVTKDVKAKIQLKDEVSSAARALASASTQLTATATQLNSNAKRSTEVSLSTSSSSEEVAQGVRTVATNTEEMSASIKEISRNASEVSMTSAKTLKQAQSTNITITQLGESSQEIGNVIKVISSIAQQTNLLALNATIEAARAGDAGRGFAVVANEVKELAKQTAKATEDITAKITGIQKDSGSAVEAVEAIGATIEKLNSIAGAIAASVEEQAATTNEVARVVQESAKGVQSITDNVKVVSDSSKETLEGANQVLASANSLKDLASQLQILVDQMSI